MHYAFVQAAVITLNAGCSHYAFGFSTYLNWLSYILSNLSYSLLINGVSKNYIIPTPGLRQGDTLSSYLFLPCFEVLTSLIQMAEMDSLIRGVELASCR